jgi:hypothetical protein
MTPRTLLYLALLASCGNDNGLGPDTALGDEAAFGVTGLRRLDRFEVTHSLSDVFGVATDDVESLLPDDLVGTNPFANNYRSQTISPVVINSYASFAQAYAAKLATQVNVPQLAGCTPAAADDRACFDKLVSNVGRRLLRRPIEQAELDRYAAAILPEAAQAGSFATAVEMLGLLFVQHPAFLYRVEHEGKLDGYEIGTRMAYLVWGSAPDDALLDAAGDLDDAKARVTQAERMLDDPRARANWQRFHAEWLGYSEATLPAAVAADLRAETNALLDRVVFEDDADWLAIFRSTETYITPALAQHYGMPAIAAPQWVTYPAGRGGGVLTHGSFLSLGAKFGDTSPTVRGAEIYRRIACGHLGTIPADVDTDRPPGLPTDCKPQRYTMRDTPGCNACHGITDNIGFGLENFGVSGQWRDVEPSKPQCTIVSNGAWNGEPYTGTEQLGALIAQDPRVSACATTQLFRFMAGRDEDLADDATLVALDALYRERPSLRGLIVALVKSPAITIRKGE